MGRAARHVEGHVILYADNVTGSMQRAIGEVGRRRAYQIAMNKKLAIVPSSITKPIRERVIAEEEKGTIEKLFRQEVRSFAQLPEIDITSLTPMDKRKLIVRLRREMKITAQDLNFELAAEIRDKIRQIEA